MNEKYRDLRLLVEGYRGCLNNAAKENQLDIIIATIKSATKKHQTVQSWESRKGKEYPQDAPVWYRTYKSCRWRFALRYEAQHIRKHDRGMKTEELEFVELVADESGTPPADWSEK